MPYKDPELKKAKDRARAKVRRFARRAEVNARQRALYAEHIEERRAYGQSWYAKHREQKNSRKRIARAKRPDKLKAHKQAYREANPEQYRQQGLEHQARRRARLRDAKYERVDYVKVIQDAKGICGICKTPFDLFGIHVDHIIPLARGGTHTYGNLQATHARCNQIKWANVG